MSEDTQSLVELPLDILSLILPYLDVKSFLSLCRACRAFQQSEIRFDALYWRQQTRSTFRVPLHLLVQHDGRRWCKLYERLLTQSRVYCWGDNEHGRLGHAGQTNFPQMSSASSRRIMDRAIRKAPLPFEVDLKEIGTIADLQCGGWSTTFLFSSGELYVGGSLSGSYGLECNNAGPRPLQFPPGYRRSRYQKSENSDTDPSTQIRQFSSGRSHVLALSETGKIWSWWSVKSDAVAVKFLTVDTLELDLTNTKSKRAFSSAAKGKVRQVVAGWDKSTAYVYGYGIIVWQILQNMDPNDRESDTMLVTQPAIVPETSLQAFKGSTKSAVESVQAVDVGVVLNYIVLDNFIVFITSLGRTFVAEITTTPQGQVVVNQPVELLAFRCTTDMPADIYGSFRTFGVLKDGEVVTSTREHIVRCLNNRGNASFDQASDPEVRRIPALQNTGVIALAFGDYHFHALHSSGHITTYGKEPNSCGALGLGDSRSGMIRGQWPERRGIGNSTVLAQFCERTGRRVWFESWRHRWLQFMAAGGCDKEEASERSHYLRKPVWQDRPDPQTRLVISEWVEQRGREWDKAGGYVPVDAHAHNEVKGNDPLRSDGNSTGAYFALSVSAAGWHSASIVLVDPTLDDPRRFLRRIPEPTPPANSPPEDSTTADDAMASPVPGAYPADADPPPQNKAKLRDGENPHGRPLEGEDAGVYEYVWADEGFPRLRLPGGGELPGCAPLSKWPYGEPFDGWNLAEDEWRDG